MLANVTAEIGVERHPAEVVRAPQQHVGEDPGLVVDPERRAGRAHGRTIPARGLSSTGRAGRDRAGRVRASTQ